jgi:hypothetical protein
LLAICVWNHSYLGLWSTMNFANEHLTCNHIEPTTGLLLFRECNRQPYGLRLAIPAPSTALSCRRGKRLQSGNVLASTGFLPVRGQDCGFARQVVESKLTLN